MDTACFSKPTQCPFQKTVLFTDTAEVFKNIAAYLCHARTVEPQRPQGIGLDQRVARQQLCEHLDYTTIEWCYTIRF
jgi:hypothetical protein